MDESAYIDKATWIAISPMLNVKTNSATILSSITADAGHWTNEMKKSSFDVKLRTAREEDLLYLDMGYVKRYLKEHGMDKGLSAQYLENTKKSSSDRELKDKSYGEMTEDEKDKFNMKHLMKLKSEELDSRVRESIINKRILDASFSRVCVQCSELPLTEQIKCNHVRLRFSRLKSTDKQEDLTDGADLEQMMLENYGASAAGKDTAFPKHILDQFFDESQWFCKENMHQYIETDVYDPTPTCYGIFIDPNAGGSNYTAFVGTKRLKNQVNVVSWIDIGDTDAIEAFDEFINGNIWNFVKNIRKKQYEIPILIFMEAQASWDASNMSKQIDVWKLKYPDVYQNVHVVCDKQKRNDSNEGRHGVMMSADRMKKMYRQFKIAIKNYMIIIDKDIQTHNSSGIKSIMDETRKEMERFRTVFVGGSKKYTASGEKRTKMTGKVALSNGEYLNDDVVIVLLMSVSWLTWFFMEDEYKDQRSKFNLSNIFVSI